MRRLSLLALLVLPTTTAWAQHPRAIWNSALISRVRGRAVASAADWLPVKGSASGPNPTCDYVTRATVGPADGLPPVYAPREPVTSNPPGTIEQDRKSTRLNS